MKNHYYKVCLLSNDKSLRYGSLVDSNSVIYQLKQRTYPKYPGSVLFSFGSEDEVIQYADYLIDTPFYIGSQLILFMGEGERAPIQYKKFPRWVTDCENFWIDKKNHRKTSEYVFLDELPKGIVLLNWFKPLKEIQW